MRSGAPSSSESRPGTGLPDLSFIDLIPTAAYVIDADARLVRWNRHAVAAWGRAPRADDPSERFCGSYRILLPDGTPIEHAQSPIARVLDTGEPVHGAEAMCERPDGTRVWAVININPLRDASGAVVGALNVFVDVSARQEIQRELRQAQERLAATEKRLSAALASARIGTWHWDAASDAITWDRSLRSVVGLDDATPIPSGQRFGEWIHADDRERTGAAIGDALARRRDYDVEFRLRHADGSWHWHRSRGRVEFDGDRPVAMTGACVDVTDLKRAQEALASGEQQLVLVTDALPACVAYVDRERRYRFVNRGAADWIGRPRHEIVGMTVAEAAGERAYALVEPKISAALAGMRVSFEAEVPWRRDAERRFAHIDYVPDLAADGTVRGYVALVQDISAIKAAERELERTADELRRSNAELEQFAYVTSHDLQEPLRMIANYLNLLRKRAGGSLDGKSQEYLGFVLDGAARMKGMIDAVLRYARVDRAEEARGEVPLAEVVDEVVADLREQIAATGARVERGELPTVAGSRALLGKVVLNLLSNALKFRGEEPPRIAVTATGTESEWVVAVADNGIGIEPSQQERLFKLFQRLHPRDAYPGDGIGLATCKRIIERLGGRIWVTSLPGRGTTFSFTIPKEPQRRSAPPAPRAAAKPARVFIVDDNAGDIMLLSDVLRERSPEIEVVGADGGHDLIARLAAIAHDDLPSAVLIDLNMPMMDGKAVLAYLKSHPIYRAIPALIYTSSMRQAERQQCLELGADDYLVKPSTLDDCDSVVERIRSVVGADQAR